MSKPASYDGINGSIPADDQNYQGWAAQLEEEERQRQAAQGQAAQGQAVQGQATGTPPAQGGRRRRQSRRTKRSRKSRRTRRR